MKEILLTQNQIALVDDEDFDFLMQWKWYVVVERKKYLYVARKQKAEEYKLSGIRKSIFMHRQIMTASSEELVDHRDGNGLNNQRSNLRVCNYKQNMYNSASWGEYSKYKGVSWHKRKNKWISSITIEGKRFHLGYFDSEEDAARAYDEQAKKYHGDFARLNLGEKC